MSTSARRSHAPVREHGWRRRRSPLHQPHKLYGSLRGTTGDSAATALTEPTLRITPPMQLEILRLYLQGYSLSEISRRTHRARQTVTKICRSPEIQDKFQELKALLLDASNGWVVSINRAVRNEMDGQLAFKLLQSFDVIPSLVDTTTKKRAT